MNYRYIFTCKDDTERISVHEVYVNENGRIYTYCMNPIHFENITSEQREKLLNSPILHGDDRFPEVYLD